MQADFEWGAILTIFAIGGALVSAGIWVGKVNTDRRNFRDFMLEVRDDIKKLLQLLPNTPVKSESPLRLTEVGKDISEKLEAHRWATQTASEINQKSPVKGKNAFDLQEIAFKYVTELQPDKGLDELIEMCAFQHGLAKEDVRKVLAIELRDALLVLAPSAWLDDISQGQQSG